jgi:hypothetical protein
MGKRGELDNGIIVSMVLKIRLNIGADMAMVLAMVMARIQMDILIG